ncbi:MAG: class I SAM-dependent rRNA methyltransferase [Bacteroidetes bacterium]|nr:class I SAM-dependent rRNA methyltransferase [Bacteroidota bacterium]
MKSVWLKSGKEKSILRKHPWIFSGAIQRVDGNPELGDDVLIKSSSGVPLGIGAYSPHSQIRIRMWSYNSETTIDKEFFYNKINEAYDFRNSLIDPSRTNSYRLIYSESDGLPGLIVDKYSGLLVCQFLSAGAEAHNELIVDCLEEVTNCKNIYERSDSDSRSKEGLRKATGILKGEISDEIEILENGVKLFVNPVKGHKTGFYLDQRDNRQILSAYAKGKTVLNCFSYTGGFGLFALQGGAKFVTNLDASRPVLDTSEKNYLLNGFASDSFENICGDAFQVLRNMRDENKKFDIIVLDPPKFAESAKQVISAARGYKDINMLACSLLNPGGLLFTFSCSGHITSELFQKIVADAALDAGTDLKIIRKLSQAEDHPVALNFPESFYLKGLICKINQ